MRPNQSGVHTGGFCSQRRQDGCWDRDRLYPADYGRDAPTAAGHQAFAAARPAGRGGMQGAESEFRNGWQATLIRDEDTTMKIIVLTALWAPGRNKAAINLLKW